MQETKERCSQNENVGMIAFDFILNLPLPSTTVQEIIYMRQLWINAFNIPDRNTGTYVMYFYHVGHARKGATEILSFESHFIKIFMPKNVTRVKLVF